MMKDSIINLQNGKSYYVLEEQVHNQIKYVLAAECNLDKHFVNQEELFLMQVENDNGNIIFKEVEDENLVVLLTEIFQDKFQNN